VAVMKCMRLFMHNEINTTEAACLRMTVLKRSGRIISVSVIKARWKSPIPLMQFWRKTKVPL
jgi:hypothetical protein